MTNPTKLGVKCNICLFKFPPKCTSEVAEPHLAHFWPPLDAGGHGTGCPTQPTNFWDGPLQLWCYKLPFSMNDHASRRTWGPGPSGSGFGVQNVTCPAKNLGCNFCFIKFLPKCTAEAPAVRGLQGKSLRHVSSPSAQPLLLLKLGTKAFIQSSINRFFE